MNTLRFRPLVKYIALPCLIICAFFAAAFQAQSAPPGFIALYKITGYLLDLSNNPVANIKISATGAVNGTNYTALPVITDSNGFFSLKVTNGIWDVSVDYGDNTTNSLDYYGFYSMSDEFVKINGANGTATFMAYEGYSQVSGYLNDASGNAISNITVFAYSSQYNTVSNSTDANGFYQLALPSDVWDFSLDCAGLALRGYGCATDLNIMVEGGAYPLEEQNFVVQATNSLVAPFFTGEAALGNQVYYLAAGSNNIFGYYSLLNFPYVYHYDLGFEYFIDAANANHGAYFYDFSSSSWVYTEPGLFPYIYSFNLNAWLYYYPNSTSPGHYTSNPRYFFNFGTGQIISF